MDTRPVFHDLRGRRRAGVSRISAAIFGLITVLATAFAVTTIFMVPILRGPSSIVRTPSLSPLPSSAEKQNPATAKERSQLLAEIRRVQKLNAKKPLAKIDQVVAGFYAPWQETGYASFRQCVGNLTHVMPAWLHLADDPSQLDFIDFKDPTDLETYNKNLSVARLARRNGVRIEPILSNGVHGDFDPDRASYLLNHPDAQEKLAIATRTWLMDQGYQGVNIDFEELRPADYAKLPGFLTELHRQFDANKLEISIDLESDLSRYPLAQIAKLADFVVLMDYDEHSEQDKPGPIASFDWSVQRVDRLMDAIPANKIVLGIGNYAYDWTTSGPEKGTKAESLTFQEALANAHGYWPNEKPNQVVQFDQDSLNETFDYQDEDDNSHTVWMLSGVTAYNLWLAEQDRGLKGAAVWALGQEDPTVWTFLDKKKLLDRMSPSSMQSIRFPRAVDYQGKGEILKVMSQPQDGNRVMKLDNDGIVVDSSYERYPLPYVIQQSGFRSPNDIVLTFDDGPDPEWTPQILAELKQLHVPGTFFLIGKNAEENPGLVRQIVEDGNEVGNHTFLHPNIGLVSDWRARLEIDTTQRAIQSITGRGTILFRPPYNADSEPETDVELKPVILASQLKYVIVGEKVDPTDWDLTVRLDDGSTRPKTAADIVQSTLEQIDNFRDKHEEGNVILLHDAGGPRGETVKALPIIVHALQKKGYRFVNIATLLNKPRDFVMPPISAQEKFAIWVDSVFFTLVFKFFQILSICFLAAIALGILRVALMTPLALVHARRIKHFAGSPDFKPMVSALIAAYNEETVIVRTIESVLASEYPIHEIVVVDDGSRDGTAESVRQAFADEPRVKLISQPNAGKATALTNAMEHSSGEVLFCIDADTLLDSQAIGMLVRHFEDEKIGAVAGNVRVGNVVNLVTLWQSIEYTTSQNVDRRAYALLNAVTVVPGAIGAWRRSAVQAAGGYVPDTFAEDMDLTWRLRIAGYRIETEPAAIAYTEAPDTFKSFFRQRFRWTFGTLQCLWKHRSATFKYGWFGLFSLPTLWLFQIFFQIIAPLVDLQILTCIIVFIFNRQLFPGGDVENSGTPEALKSLQQVGFLYALFFGIELLAGAIAFRMDRQRLGGLWWLFLQRFVYRQILYMVAWKAFIRAIRGTNATWGKLERKGTVQVAVGRKKA